MNSLKLAWRKLFRKGEHTVTRIVSLAAGLAFGILLLSEVLYYYSFDSCYPEANRIYSVYENFRTDKSSDQLESYPGVSGAIAPGLKAEVSGIEAATRFNSIGSSVFYTEDKKSYQAAFSLADECLFDVLPRPMISGDPREILKTPMNCIISAKIAEEIGGNAIGKVIELKEYPGRKLTIAGIFKTLPENVNYKYDILISMVSTTQFFTYDGSQNWLGNDRYRAFVKLAPGVSAESLTPAVRKMQEKNQDIVRLEQVQGGMVLKYSFVPIKSIYPSSAKDMILILSLIAFSVLFVSLMNYILLTLSALVNRAKTSAIHKCCGAQSENLQYMIFSETFLLFILSLLSAIAIILVIKPFAEAQVGHSLASALTSSVIWPILGLMGVLVIFISYLPGRFFSRIPIATAFRSYRQKGNRWKLGLLSVQFIGASFILTVLVIVSLQYNQMKNADHGYGTEGVYFSSTSGMEGQKVSTVLNELRAMPEIEKVGLGCGVPTEGASGNNVLAPGEEHKELFNVADFYWVDENYLSILNIPVKSGENFSSNTAVYNDVLISQKGADMLKINNSWADGVIGKQISITEHNINNISTIRGVFPDFIIQSISSPDYRPSVFFYMPEEQFAQSRIDQPSFSFIILIKAQKGAQAGLLKKITDVINGSLPYQDAVVHSLADEQQKTYHKEKGFRNAMMAGNLIILLITCIGLAGYTSNETTRRRKELAIRRISGAHFTDILRMFILDLEYIALPAVLVGLIAAWYTADIWMQNFASKISLHWTLFVACCLCILLLIAVTAAINYIRIANHNPVEALRYE
ncbi:MAG: ABC transporter permease [Bacteroidales bacterium]|nr:ABC transporter permease [Bacteroidales bacterium]